MLQLIAEYVCKYKLIFQERPETTVKQLKVTRTEKLANDNNEAVVLSIFVSTVYSLLVT